MHIFKWATAVVAAVLLTASPSSASTLTGNNLNLSLGGSYVGSGLNIDLTGYYNNKSEGGGNITPSSLNGTPLLYTYCVDLLHTIAVPANYLANVNDLGKINNSSAPPADVLAGPPIATLANAGAIAWLMTNIAPIALTSDQQLGLQAALWKEVYGADFTLNAVGTTAGAFAAYNTYLGLLGSNTAPIDSVLWINPHNAAGTEYYQGLVAVPVPVPATLTMSSILLAMVGIFVGARRFKSLSSLSA
jgi:hypothetical protein